MDNDSMTESPICNEETEETLDGVSDDGGSIEAVSRVSMICSISNLHSTGSYDKSNENISNFAASRASNPEESNPAGLHADDSICDTISAITLDNIEKRKEHFGTNENVDDLTEAYFQETVLPGGSIQRLDRKEEDSNNNDSFGNLAARRSSNTNEDNPTGLFASDSICNTKPATATGYNVEPTMEHNDSDEDEGKDDFITINIQETVLQGDTVKAETRKPSLIDHGQGKKSSYIDEGELGTIRAATNLQKDAAERSSITMHNTHAKMESQVLSISNSSDHKLVLDEALDLMKTQLPQSLEFDIRDEALAVVQDTANAYKKLLGKKHRLTVEANNYIATVW